MLRWKMQSGIRKMDREIKTEGSDRKETEYDRISGSQICKKL